MTIGNLGMYHSDGRLRGCYVYMLLCRDDGPVYVKVGMSVVPTRRLRTLCEVCAVTPRQFHFLELRSKRKALDVERDLLKALEAWSTTGEWCRVPMAERDAFNAAWRGALDQHREYGWPMKWEQIAVAPFQKLMREKQLAFQRRFAKASKAQQDYLRVGGTLTYIRN